MYRVVIEDDKYNRIAFKFSSMEEVSVFVETVLMTSEKTVKVKIELLEEEEDND